MRLDRVNLTSVTCELKDDVKIVSVPSFTLFSSRLTPRGPIYTQRGTWHLRGA